LVFQVEIEDDEGNRSVIPITRSEITIGRQGGNVIRLTDRNVSRQHAILYSRDDKLSLEDLESYTGTHLNGQRIEGNSAIGQGDVVRIGDYELRILGEGVSSDEPDDSQVTQIDRLLPGGIKIPAAALPGPIMEDDDDDQDPTAVINMRAGLGQQLGQESFEGLLDGPPARLVVVSAQLAGTEYTIDRSPARLGRGSECEVRVEHRSISRHHATIEVVEGHFVIKDVGSANGISVNGETYASVRLQPGDRIDLGHIQLRFFPPGQIPEFADLLSLQRRPHSSIAPTALLTIAMVALAGGAYWALKGRSDSASEAQQTQLLNLQRWSKTMQELRDGKRWHEALRHLEKAPQDIPTKEINSLRAELSNERGYQERLEAALAKEGAKNWSEALEDLQAIPKNSVYFEQAELHRKDVRDAFVRLEIDLAAAAILGGSLDKAAEHLSSAETYAPDGRKVRSLRHKLDGAVAERDKTHSNVSPNQVAAKRHATKAAPKRKKKKRSLNASQLVAAANQRLMESRPKAALPLLLQALKKNPRHAQVHRGLGITYASLQQNDNARRHYMEYLRLAPNAQDAPQLRRMLGVK
jgi:pSer/pThr/pTyr-binding forkhead associated (FHA) protein